MEQVKPKKRMFVALVVSFSMIFLNATFLPIALPQISNSLNINASSLFWVVNAYFITSCSMFLLGGRLVRRFGPLKIFRVGICFYLVGSVLALCSFNLTSLLTGRVLCGFGGAMISPATFSVIVHTYSESVRGKKIGTLIGMSSMALMMGPFLGGLLTQLFTWRALFLLNILVGIVAFILAARARVKFTAFREKLDVLGFFSFTLSIATLIYVITTLGARGFSTTTFILLGCIVLFVSLLVFSSRRAEHPYFDFRLLKRQSFLLAILVVFFSQSILSISFFWPIYFLIEGNLGTTPIQVGSVISFATLGLFIFSPIAGVYFDKKGFKRPIILGWSVLSVALAGIAFSISHPEKWQFIICFVLFGIGISFISTPSGTLAQHGVEKSMSGMVSGLYNTVRFFGSSMGVATWGSLINYWNRTTFYQNIAAPLKDKIPSFKVLSKAKIGGNFQEQLTSTLSQGEISYISNLWNLSYQKSFFFLHICLLCLAITVLCVLIGCRKRNFIDQFSK